MDLNTNIQFLNKIGEATAKRFSRLGVKTIKDLLYFFPFRYEDYSQSKKIVDLEIGEKINISGTIEMIQNKKSSRKKMTITEALVSDGTDSIKIIWFNQAFILKNLKIGDRVSLSGKIENDFGSLIMKSPNYEKIFQENNIHTQGLIPIYHSTANISQKQIRFLIKNSLKYLNLLEDIIPSEILTKLKLEKINQAIEKIHFPRNIKDIDLAQKRLAFDELFLIQIKSLLLKKSLSNKKAQNISFFEEETKTFVNKLDFELTNSQRKVSWEIIKDIAKKTPMSRLLEGDVGSGKTIVASLILFNVFLDKKQSAFMVPTEILAEQHNETLVKLFENYKINIALITGTKSLLNNKKTDKKKISSMIKNGKVDLIVGTHALIQKNIQYKNLSFVVIDEQHRFGVEQRKTLLEKSGLKKDFSPHFLSMTATPIPRSLALSIYGNLDISIINEMPKNRMKIITKVINNNKEDKLYKFMEKEILKGRQVFVVCPLIDFSEKLEVKSVEEVFENLSNNVFPKLKVEILHGKLKNTEKESTMNRFKNKEIDILVSTSVIEVGIDIPNASIMLIEGADRFGLSQLHQFRGRIGRSSYQSYCFLRTESKSEQSRERLHALEKHNNGFELSKIDLKMRGPGEFYGLNQKGFPELKVATLFDYELIKLSRKIAEEIISYSPDLKKYPILAKRLSNFEENIHLE